jgi:hypothetical protein
MWGGGSAISENMMAKLPSDFARNGEPDEAHDTFKRSLIAAYDALGAYRVHVLEIYRGQ